MMTAKLHSTAPELKVDQWLNVDGDLSLEELRGRVVLIEAFQMLCPGCVAHGLPQAARVTHTFSSNDVQVLGLHSVFEHHSAQGTREALAAFLHEYGIRFPVAIDKPSESGPVPQTMAMYRLQGTPSTILIDRRGIVRAQHFGRLDDMTLGAEIMALVKEEASAKKAVGDGQATNAVTVCDEDGCRVQS